MKTQKRLIFTAQSLIPVIEEARKNNCTLLLVKDHGVYIMSVKGKRDEHGQRLLSFAQGCNPRNDDNWYDYAREIMGGDDCCDHLNSSDRVFDIVLADKKDLKVNVAKTRLDLYIEL